MTSKRSHTKTAIVTALILLTIMLYTKIITPTYAAMSSTNYLINWDTVSVGGVDNSTSASYLLRDSVGAQGDQASSTTYKLDQGYRAGLYDQVADFDLFVQNTASQVATTAITTTTTTVTSVAGFAVGDLIAIIQDEGASQVAAVGKVVGVSSPTLTVDYFTFAVSLPIIDGSNDYVYKLTGSTTALTTLSPNTLSTGIIAWQASADVPNGYSVQVMQSGNLASGNNIIASVTDGTVTTGQNEYGGRSSDVTIISSTFDTQDTGFTTSLQPIATRTDSTINARDFITIKAAVSGANANGTYSQNLIFVFIGEY